MHIPAEAVFKRLLSERAVLLFVPEDGDYPYSIIIKISQTLIKEIQKGCKVRLGLFIHEQAAKKVLITFLEIFDDLTFPAIVSFPQCRVEYHEALLASLIRNTAPVFFYDESSRLTTETICQFNDPDRGIKKLGDIGQLFSGDEDKVIENGLDRLLEQINSRATPADDVESLTIMDFQFDDFHNPKINVYGLNQEFSFSVADADEGAAQEISVWHKLENMFLGNIYRSAWWLDNGIKKELTDIFAYTELGIFIVESKAVSVFNKQPNRATQRREQDVLKDIQKGLKQVVGAARTIAKNIPIYGSSHTGDIELKFDRSICPHGIILISDASLIFKGKDTITKEVLELSRTHRMLIQILDLTELNYIVTRLNDRIHFDGYLVSRFQATVERENAFIRMDIVHE